MSVIKKRKKLRIWQLVLIDLVGIGVGLNLFALFHHVLHFDKVPEPVMVMTVEQTVPPTETPTLELNSEPAEEETVPDRPGRWGNRFREKFIDGEPVVTDTSYVSENINVSISHVEKDGIIYNLADIYISDLMYLKAGFAQGEFRKGTAFISDLSSELGAVVAISGDHYGARQEGTVLRNGILYRQTRNRDICVIDSDGVMTTYIDEEFNLDAILENGAWQIWSFGPQLLDDGNVMTEFNSDVTRANPRSAIGYVEPGHYYFLQVDGRIDASRGMTMEELSRFFYDLGCTSAYNLDGGQSAGFTWMGSLISYPYNRPVWDIIYIGE